MFSIAKIRSPGRAYRHLKRYRQILQVLFKYGFGELIDKLKLEQYIEIGLEKLSRKSRPRLETMTGAERFKLALEELGPTFIKMGQILSTRPDLVPMEYVRELSQLQDEVPPFAYREVKEVMRAETGKSPEELFARFDESPRAAASIGQVHQASLKDGTDVVVKVQRPGIKEIIATDLEIMLHLASLMEKYIKEMEVLRPARIVEEFARTLEEEIDYNTEASHIERFARQFEGEETIRVPRVYRELSTERILTMEDIHGIKADNIDLLREKDYDLKEIASRGADLIMKQIFVFGYFHADPHPGNIFILPGNIICYVDFGMMGRISRPEREIFTDLLMAVIGRNEKKATEALLQLTDYDREPDRARLEGRMGELIDQYSYLSLKELNLGKLLEQFLELITKNNLVIKPRLFLMMKALGTVEGLGVELDPEFDIIKRAEPFVRRIQLERFNPKRIASDLIGSSIELAHLMKEIPGQLRALLKQTREGKLQIEFKHRGLDRMFSTHERISNRVAFAIVLSSLIIGSSLIVLSRIPPKWNDIPLIGLAGFLVAGIMGFWLLITILRHGKM